MLLEIAVVIVPTVLEAQAGAVETLVAPLTVVVADTMEAGIVLATLKNADALTKAKHLVNARVIVRKVG